MRSLRLRLFALLAALGAGVALAVGFATYASVRAEADALFDYQLRQMALSLRDQGRIGADERAALANPEFDFVVQVWSLDGVAVYSSHPVPALPPRAVLGYATAEAGGEAWRVFAAATPARVVQVAQPLRVRGAFARAAAWRAVRPVMVAVPLVGLAMWWVLGWSLAPLQPVQQALGRRGAGDLTPLPVAGLPAEVRPLVDGFNGLLARLDQAFGAQRAFVADAAHELRTPLTALKLQLGLLRHATAGPERDAALERLGAGVERAARLVEQLLALARSEPGAGGAAAPVDLAALVREVLHEAAPQAAARSVPLDATIAADLPPLAGDADALRAAVRNLVDNALKHGGGPVRVALQQEGGALVLTVDDAGPGVPAAGREALFQRFHRGAATGAEGSGLGLAIVRAAAQRHGGTVALLDAPGGGLRARLVLPSS